MKNLSQSFTNYLKGSWNNTITDNYRDYTDIAVTISLALKINNTVFRHCIRQVKDTVFKKNKNSIIKTMIKRGGYEKRQR